MDKKVIRFNVMAILLIIIFCAAITPVSLQNDTFYTIKIGEHILENGVKVGLEPFAWHEELEYTFPHWAYDVFTYFIYNIGGMTGIYIVTIILTCILGLVLYFTNVKLIKNRSISFILTIGTLYLLKPYICARAQLVTFILFILTIFFIEKFLETKKIRYAIGLIIIPILIANIHLATFYFYFILYLPYIVEYMIYILSYCNVIISDSVVQSIKNKIKKQGETEELLKKLQKAEEKHNKLKEKQDNKMKNPYKIKIAYNENVKWLIVILIICVFTGFLTPLGTTPYTYLIKTMQGISTKNINEHLPIVLANNFKVLVLLCFYIFILMFTKVKARISDLFMLAGLIFLSITSKRQVSMLLIIGIFILNRLIIGAINDKKKIEKIENYFSKYIIITLISVIVIAIAIFEYRPKIEDKYINEISYPVQATQWIKENLNLSEIKLYNEYNYGSYLLFQGVPVFIDSRCDLYLPEFNKDATIFKDFLNINNMNLKNVEKKLEKYGFTHFILSKDVKFKMYIDDHTEKYKKIYPTGDIEDDNFTIYERIK